MTHLSHGRRRRRGDVDGRRGQGRHEVGSQRNRHPVRLLVLAVQRRQRRRQGGRVLVPPGPSGPPGPPAAVPLRRGVQGRRGVIDQVAGTRRGGVAVGVVQGPGVVHDDGGAPGAPLAAAAAVAAQPGSGGGVVVCRGRDVDVVEEVAQRAQRRGRLGVGRQPWAKQGRVRNKGGGGVVGKWRERRAGEAGRQAGKTGLTKHTHVPVCRSCSQSATSVPAGRRVMSSATHCRGRRQGEGVMSGGSEGRTVTVGEKRARALARPG